MQDIVPKKSIREITKPHVPRALLAVKPEHLPTEPKKIPKEVEPVLDEYPHKNIPYQKERGRGRSVLFFLVVLMLGLAVFLHFQKSATIHITPEQQALTFKDSEVIVPMAEIKTILASATTTIDIKTNLGAPVLSKAKGTVTIYNANSTEQSLVANTRLEAPNGKIYRLDNKIVVPKASIVGGKSVPGSIQALVTADKAGESYNTTQSDFTFPGLVGSPRYKNVYARTKGALSGGSEAKTFTLDEKDKNQKIEAFIKEISESLKAEITTKKASDTVVIREAVIVPHFEKISDTKGSVVAQGSLYSIDMNTLATVLTKTQKPNSTTSMKFIGEPETLLIEYVSESKTDVRIKVTGSVAVKTNIPESEIKELLALQPFSEFRTRIKTIDGIQEVSFTSKPFWVSVFPPASQIFIKEK